MGAGSSTESRHPSAAPWDHYRLIVEGSSDVVYQTDLDGILEWVSPSVTALLGVGPDDLVGTVALDLVHPDDASQRGVETAEQAAVLLVQGWHLGQGWLYGRPGPLGA